jgi:hypothetical protein
MPYRDGLVPLNKRSRFQWWGFHPRCKILRYFGGGEAPFWSAPLGLLITDPVIPPEGFELQPTTVEWASLKQVDLEIVTGET